VYKKFFKLIKHYIFFFEVKKFLESLIFGVSKKWLSKIEKVNFLAKIWLNFREFNEDALRCNEKSYNTNVVVFLNGSNLILNLL
jgi:hypothetical protein